MGASREDVPHQQEEAMGPDEETRPAEDGGSQEGRSSAIKHTPNKREKYILRESRDFNIFILFFIEYVHFNAKIF